jgi:PAS domain-containing protein
MSDLPTSSNAWLDEILEELDLSLEELRVAEEDMYQQDEALAQAHEKLLHEHRRYKTLFESAPDGYLTTTLNGIIMSANQSSTEFTCSAAVSSRQAAPPLYRS